MNTCKATLRVLFAHRVYLMIYLVFIGILMMSISWAMDFLDLSTAQLWNSSPTW